MDTKQCTKCDEVKPLSEFYQNARSKDGRFASCAACERGAAIVRGRERAAARSPEEHAAHLSRKREQYSRVGKAQGRARRASPEYAPARAVNSRRHRLRKYGLTPDQYAAMLAGQQGRCAVCGKLGPTDWSGSFPVDHDHETGAMRGILCAGCNTAIGLMGDDPDRLLAAAAYLLSSRSVRDGILT
jgi:hypothetical protein